VAVEVVDDLAEVAGALIAGSARNQRARAVDSSDGVSGSWKIACNLLMQHVRFFPWLEKNRRKISNARGTRGGLRPAAGEASGGVTRSHCRDDESRDC
jgi:hypothetical protein